MLDVLTLAEEDTNLHRAAVREQAGPCPNPQCRCQTDGFRVKWNGEQWVFMCRGCWDAQELLPDGRKRAWGDAIDYLRHYRGLSFQAAKALASGNEQTESRPAPVPAKEDWQSETWQRKVAQVMHTAVAAIWTPEGAAALDYVRGRGLSDETIRQFQLGYDARDDVPRLLIPSMNERRYTTIYRRDLRPDRSDPWKDAPGGTKSELYLADCLLRKDYPVVLVEDVFSALSIWQACHDLVNVVATGGATCGKLTKWLARLALAPRVLIALDADEAGDDEADWWLERLGNVQRLRPTCSKDANDMLQAGLSLRQWIVSALPALQPESVIPMCPNCHTIIDVAWDANVGQYRHERPLCMKWLGSGQRRAS